MGQQKIFTKAILSKLKSNFAATQKANGEEITHKPVIKVFNPYGSQTWLFSEYDEESDLLFGLCDLGMGSPELGYQARAEIEEFRVNMGGCKLPFERDAHWTPNGKLLEYAEAAWEKGSIVSHLPEAKAEVEKPSRHLNKWSQKQLSKSPISHLTFSAMIMWFR